MLVSQVFKRGGAPTQLLVKALRSNSHHMATRQASSISGRVIMPKHKLRVIEKQGEYKQLPDDSQFIEKFYDELLLFKNEMEVNDNIKAKSFSDFEDDPNEMIHQLELFIEGKAKPGVSASSVSVKYAKFDELVRNVKTTLILNGGHPMIFDILLQSKAHFDGFDKMKKK